MRCLVTGATGYIGGRLAPRLLEAGHAVRCLSRSAGRLRDVPWADRGRGGRGRPVRPGARCRPRSRASTSPTSWCTRSASPTSSGSTGEAAHNFAAAASAAGVSRIVYLGGPEPPPGEHAVGRTCARAPRWPGSCWTAACPRSCCGPPVIIGSGSASFEMLRYLTERLPVMVTPRWVKQPDPADRGPRRAALPDRRGRAAGRGQPRLRHRRPGRADLPGDDAAATPGWPACAARIILPLRPLSPWLSAHWVGAITPVPNAIARPLVASLIHEAIAHEHDIAEYVPGRRTCSASTRRSGWRSARSATRTWRPAGPPRPAGTPPPSRCPATRTGPAAASTSTSAAARWTRRPAALWRVIEGVGGENGWYSFPLAWSVRGWLDRLVGGVGLRRGRRDRHHLLVGEALDWWRVEEIVPGRAAAAARRDAGARPGLAGDVGRAPDGDGRSVYRQRAVFLPRGLAGHAYWASVLPFHGVVFSGMARNIARGAEAPVRAQTRRRGAAGRGRPASPRCPAAPAR